MKKNKLVTFLCVLFCVSFLLFLNKLDSDILNLDTELLASPNIVNATGKLDTKLFIGPEDQGTSWSKPDFDDSKWESVTLPHWLPKEKNFKVGSYAYYRIRVPYALMESLQHLKNEVSLNLYYVHLSSLDMFVNGEFYRRNTPKTYDEAILVIPVDEKKENIIGIKAKLAVGDTGVNHRTPLMLGKNAELGQVYTTSYKGQTVGTLIYILCKGSILFIFGLIFFVVRVDKFFEKFLMFGIFTVCEDVLRGDFVTSFMNLDQMVVAYNFVNIGIIVYLFLFLADVVGASFNRRLTLGLGALLLLVSLGVTVDALNQNTFFSIDSFLKFWNVMLMLVLIFYVPKMFRVDKIMAFILSLSMTLTFWSTFLGANVAHNLKVVGNLLLFFMAAYQTFLLFKKEQDLSSAQQLALKEQEKDVAIGQTAALLAHDVRRPLEQMNLILNRISTGNFTEEFLKVAKRDVEFSIISVNNQVNDIMNFSRTKEVSLEKIDFYKLLAGSLKQVLTINRKVDLDLDYEFKAPFLILGDESRLSSLLTNLISNALEAIRDIGDKNHGRIRLTTATESGKFVFKIFNDGPWIPKEVLSEIFKPLFTHGKKSGTGLGLASVAKIVREHGAEITVVNLESGGVEFEIKFQLSDALGPIPMEQFKSSSKAYSYSDKVPELISEKPLLRIFLLDDDAQVVEYFSFLVKNLTFEVELTYSSDYVEGSRMVREKRFDLYVLDFDLGDPKNGLDFYHENLKFLGTEVVIHSNRSGEVVTGENCGYLSKPMSVEDLNQKAQQVYQSRLKFLLVDDSELTRMAWEMFHGKQNVVSFSSPEEALAYLRSSPAEFSLCVLDYYFDNSPMNGKELAWEIQALLKNPRIIIASNADGDFSPYQAIKKDAFDVRRI